MKHICKENYIFNVNAQGQVSKLFHRSESEWKTIQSVLYILFYSSII